MYLYHYVGKTLKWVRIHHQAHLILFSIKEKGELKLINYSVPLPQNDGFGNSDDGSRKVISSPIENQKSIQCVCVLVFRLS